MKRIILCLTTIMLALTAGAVPAKPGLWRNLRLADGTEVRAQLCGDEHNHFWMAEDGQRYTKSGDTFAPISLQQLQSRATARHSRSTASRLLSPKKVEAGDRTHYLGKKKGLVILAQFTNVKFRAGNDSARYCRILNEEGYREGDFKGSVADYFKDQSAGQFELDFDVVGPFTLKNNQRYYGGNDRDGNEEHAGEMIAEACQMADKYVDFKDYDWDGDGEADQVFVVYAGKGEADGGSEDTVWPHMWTLDEAYGESLTLDGITINTYACSNELDASNNIEGIGVFCHEFSHCMGFPDFYDINYSGWFGMGDLDLMCSGSYNGDGFIPAGYTAHEKMMCGWQEPIVLGDTAVTVSELMPMSNNGNTYIIYNEAHPDEYFMIENRQKTGWDAGYPARGLMITHVDFDKLLWMDNTPNTEVTQQDMRTYGYAKTNDHQRMTIVHADNDDDSKYWNDYVGYYTYTTTSTDLFPYKQNNALTAKTTPAPKLYNKNSKGRYTVEWGITDIKQNADGTMSFSYVPNYSDGDDTPDNPTPGPTGDYLFYESFDQCAGTGGNDDNWSSQVASSKFTPDNDGWDYQTAYGGYECARFGSSKKPGEVSTPAFETTSKATLTFKAAAWGNDGKELKLSVDGSDVSIEPSTFTMTSSEWSTFTAHLSGAGKVTITFTPAKRFFLDEVIVVDSSTDDIKTVTTTDGLNRIYTLDGRFVGTDRGSLRRGIYVMNGKKFVK